MEHERVSIFWQDIYTIDIPRPEVNQLWEGLTRAAKKFGEPTTDVTFSHTDKLVPSVLNSYYDAVNSIALATKIVIAGEEGYDAAVAGCYLDPKPEAIRSARIPSAEICSAVSFTARASRY